MAECPKGGNVYSTTHRSCNPRRSYLEVKKKGKGGGTTTRWLDWNHCKTFKFHNFIIQFNTLIICITFPSSCSLGSAGIEEPNATFAHRWSIYQALLGSRLYAAFLICGQSSFAWDCNLARHVHSCHIWSTIHSLLGVRFLRAFVLAMLWSQMGHTSGS